MGGHGDTDRVALQFRIGKIATLNLAWMYVGSRIVHSLVQATVNKVVVRFTVFAFGSLVLVCITARELIRIF